MKAKFHLGHLLTILLGREMELSGTWVSQSGVEKQRQENDSLFTMH